MERNVLRNKSRTKRGPERQRREREILACRMKLERFATGSVGHKVASRLLAKLARLGDEDSGLVR